MTRKCRICRQPYAPVRAMQPTCSNFDCQHAYAMKALAKRQSKQKADERKEIKARKEKLKGRRDYLKEAQVAFNQWIRQRDYGRPCICCGKTMDWTGNKVDSGHYRSTGSAPHMRFIEDNCHAQDKQCNRWGAGRAVDYRIGLIARIGLARVEALEADNEPKKYSIEDLRNIRDIYREKLRKLKKGES